MPGLRASERLSAMCPIDLETVPFWASLTCHPALAGSCMTTPRCTFTCVIHSRFPGQSCSPVQQFWLFFPLSTRVYQAHAEGRGCLPFTREAGVAPHEFCGVVAIPLARYHLPAWICSYEDQTTLAAHPQPVRAVSSEQVADKACTGRWGFCGTLRVKHFSDFGFFPAPKHCLHSPSTSTQTVDLMNKTLRHMDQVFVYMDGEQIHMDEDLIHMD